MKLCWSGNTEGIPLTLKNCRVRPHLIAAAIMLFFARPCVAQQTPRWEFFSGYSLQRFNIRQYYKSTPITYAAQERSVNLSGWQISLTENRGRRYGGTLDLRGHYATPTLSGTSTSAKMYSIMYGPRFYRRTPKVTFFVQGLIGAAATRVAATPTGPHASDLSLAMAGGGGLDWNLRLKTAIRLLQAEYFRTSTLGTSPNGFRASAGIVFYFGGEK